jgi:hypothetical protein
MFEAIKNYYLNRVPIDRRHFTWFLRNVGSVLQHIPGNTPQITLIDAEAISYSTHDIYIPKWFTAENLRDIHPNFIGLSIKDTHTGSLALVAGGLIYAKLRNLPGLTNEWEARMPRNLQVSRKLRWSLACLAEDMALNSIHRGTVYAPFIYVFEDILHGGGVFEQRVEALGTAMAVSDDPGDWLEALVPCLMSYRSLAARNDPRWGYYPLNKFTDALNTIEESTTRARRQAVIALIDAIREFIKEAEDTPEEQSDQNEDQGESQSDQKEEQETPASVTQAMRSYTTQENFPTDLIEEPITEDNRDIDNAINEGINDPMATPDIHLWDEAELTPVEPTYGEVEANTYIEQAMHVLSLLKTQAEIPDSLSKEGYELDEGSLYRAATDQRVWLDDQWGKGSGNPQYWILGDMSGSIRQSLQKETQMGHEVLASALLGIHRGIVNLREDVTTFVFADNDRSRLYEVAINNDYDIAGKFRTVVEMQHGTTPEGPALRRLRHLIQERRQENRSQIVITLNDGAPTHHTQTMDADEYVQSEVKALRDSGVHVFNISLVAGVVENNQENYGEDWVIDASNRLEEGLMEVITRIEVS